MKRMAAACLAALALCALTACGAGGGGSVKEGLYYEASGICPDAVLLTVNGRDIPAERYFYWLTRSCDSVALAGEPDWDGARDEGTLADYVKEEALRCTVTYALVEQWAEEKGLALTDADRAALAADFQADAEKWGGEDAYLTALADMGLDKAAAERLSASHYLYLHLQETWQSETGETLDDALSRGVEEATVTYADTWDTIDPAAYSRRLSQLRAGASSS